MKGGEIMSVGINSRNIDDLHPTLARGCRELIRRMAELGFPPVGVNQTFRDAEYQNWLFGQGRPNERPHGRAGNIVTNVRGGFSIHQYRLAFDIHRNVSGQAFNDRTSEERNFWNTAGQIWIEMGGVWGGNWTGFVDRPHMEYTGGLTINDLRAGHTLPHDAKMPWEDGQKMSISHIITSGNAEDSTACYIYSELESPKEQAIPSWGVEPWNWAIKNGITDGTRHHDNSTRLETIALIYRTLEFISNHPITRIGYEAETLPFTKQSLPATETLPETSPQRNLNLSDFEIDMLCRMVWAEARGEDDLGQRLVAHVILNRLEHSLFPDFLVEVLTQSAQFSPVRDGSFNNAQPDERIRQNVLAALNKADESQGALWFNKVIMRETSWAAQNRTHIFDYGGHSFYI